jgi:hypothetical protein
VVLPPAQIRRHFLPWDRPLPAAAVAWLVGGWSGEGPLDLANWLVVVPTRQAGRRLREALAAHAAERGQAVFPPHVATPDGLIAPELPAGAATRLESLLAWAEVLRGIELEEYREVFPVDPPARQAAWALSLAEQLVRLQGTLGEGGLRIADVPRCAGGEFPEAERWRQLAALEGAYDEALAAIDRRDERAARIAAAAAPHLPPNVSRIAIVGTPDPLGLALRALAAVAEAGVTVAVVVHAPPEEAEHFDGWGRPKPETWAQREIVLPEFARRVQLCADPAAQAERIVAAALRLAPAEGLLAVGVADAEVLAPAENELARAGLAAFNPEGRPRARDGLHADGHGEDDHEAAHGAHEAQDVVDLQVQRREELPDALGAAADRDHRDAAAKDRDEEHHDGGELQEARADERGREEVALLRWAPHHSLHRRHEEQPDALGAAADRGHRDRAAEDQEEDHHDVGELQEARADGRDLRGPLPSQDPAPCPALAPRGAARCPGRRQACPIPKSANCATFPTSNAEMAWWWTIPAIW